MIARCSLQPSPMIWYRSLRLEGQRLEDSHQSLAATVGSSCRGNLRQLLLPRRGRVLGGRFRRDLV